MEKTEQITWSRRYSAIFVSLFFILENDFGRYIVTCMEGDAPLRSYFYHWHLAWFRILVITVPTLWAITHKMYIQKDNCTTRHDKATYILSAIALLGNIIFMTLCS